MPRKWRQMGDVTDQKLKLATAVNALRNLWDAIEALEEDLGKDIATAKFIELAQDMVAFGWTDGEADQLLKALKEEDTGDI